jgi:hypothetical protein
VAKLLCQSAGERRVLTIGKPAIVRLLLWIGILLPAVDVCLIVGFASLHPDYSHLRQLMSELGEEGRPFAGLVNIWFAISSLLLVGFGLAMAASLPRSSLAAVATTLFLVWAGLGIGTALFACDPGCAGKTLSGWLHWLLGEIAAAAMLPVPSLVWWSLRGDPRGRGFGWLTAAVQTIAVLASLGLAAAAYESEVANQSLRELAGLFQRICWADYYLWIVAIGIRLLTTKPVADANA